MSNQANQTDPDEYERAHYCIMACTKVLSEINTDNCSDDEDKDIPSAINNGFVIGGLIEAIKLANDVLIGKSHK